MKKERDIRECTGCEQMFEREDLNSTGGSEIYCDSCYEEQIVEAKKKGIIE